MFKFFLATGSSVLLVASVLYVHFDFSNDPVQQNMQIDGIYNLSSEKTELVKPKSVTYRNSPDWSGRFHFQDGHFSFVLVNNNRNVDWFTNFPKNVKELGFESIAGKYEIDGRNLVLKPELKLHPFYGGRLRTFEVKVENEQLVLTENIYPYREDLSEGRRVLVLQKVK